MEKELDVNEKAKRCLKRYKVRAIIWAICITLVLVPVIGFVVLKRSVTAILLVGIAVLLSARFVKRFLWGKYFISILLDDLDADTYLAMICQGRLDRRGALLRLDGEYFCGNYQNVVSICRKKQADPKIAQRYRYYYLVYLANVYFDLGDDESLRQVCEQYELAVAAERPGKQKKLRTKFTRMEFFSAYLRGDAEACAVWMNKSTIVMRGQHRQTFYKARLAIMQGKTDVARVYYEELAGAVPQLCYGKLAARILERMKNPESAQDAHKLYEEEPLDETLEVPLYPMKRRGLKLALCALLFSFGVGILVLSALRGDRADRAFEREMAAYREGIRVLVEEDHDGVEVLDSFTLKNGNEVVDTMFICKTDTVVMVGCLYTYEGVDERYYESLATVSAGFLTMESSTPLRCAFPSKTSTNIVIGYFYTKESDLPSEYYHLSTFTVDGQTVYFAVTEIR